MRQPAPPFNASQTLERTFAVAAMLAAAGAFAVGCLMQIGYSAPVLYGIPCAVLGCCAAIGIWAREALERAQRGEVARVYAAALSGRRDARLERGGDPTRMESLGIAFIDLIQTARHAAFGRDSLVSSMIDGRRSIETSRQQGRSVIAGMAEDAHAIARAAEGSREVERSFATCMQTVRGKAETAELATAALAGEAEALADAIRAITIQTEHATALAARLAETAFATQRGVACIGESTGAVVAAADQVLQVLQRADTTDSNLDSEAAQAGDAALEQMRATLHDLKLQTAAVFERVQEIADVVQAQHEFGHALSHAAMLQADAVGRVVRQISAAHDEVHGLRTQVSDTVLPRTRLGVTQAAQLAVERLPGYADAMAQILRGLPDFSTIEKAEKAKEKT